MSLASPTFRRELADVIAVRMGLCPVGTTDEILYAIEARDAEARRLLDEVMRAYLTWKASWGVVTLPPLVTGMKPVVVLTPDPEAFPHLRAAHEALDSYLQRICTFDPVLAN